MLRVHDDGVFIIIDIRRILEAPRLTVHGHGHDAKILPRRVRNRARVADILHAQQALRITGRLFQLRRRNVARVFFGFGQIDRDLKLAVLRVGNPVLILRNAVAANIVAVLTQLIEVVGRRFRTFRVERPEFPHNLRRPRRDTTHQARVKQVALRNGVVDLSLFCRIITQNIQTFRKLIVLFLLFIAFQFQFRKQTVSRECLVQRVQEFTIFRVIEQRIERRPDCFNLHTVPPGLEM